MLSTEPTNYSAQAAGKALASEGWNRRKDEKRALSMKCRAGNTVKIDKQVRNAAQALAGAADACLDKFIERIEQILRRDGAEELLKRIDQVLPEREPVELGKL